MPKKPFVWLTVMLSMLLPLVAACGSTPSTSTNTSHATTPPGGENLYVLDGYTPQGATNIAQHIVAFHPGNSNAALTLPAGLTSMDHRLLIVAQAQAGQTTITVINTRSGTTLRALTLGGSYSTAGQDFNHAVLSFDGRWLALRRLDQSSSATTIALVDTQAGKLAKTIHLNGDFDLDAISPETDHSGHDHGNQSAAGVGGVDGIQHDDQTNAPKHFLQKPFGGKEEDDAQREVDGDIDRQIVGVVQDGSLEVVLRILPSAPI